MASDASSRTNDPRAMLERTLIDDYVRGAGHDPHVVRSRGDDAARMLLLSATAYAQSRLRADGKRD